MKYGRISLLGFGFLLLFGSLNVWAQSSGSIEGVVKDPSGGVLANATVEISNAVSGYRRSTTTGAGGDFRFSNLPLNSYHLVTTASGFSSLAQDVDVRSSVPVMTDISLKLGAATENITVEATGADLVETESTPHTDVDRELFDKLPLESQSSSLSSLVTLASPGVVADSNGLFHGLGDHAENAFSVDGQPITDQQSKVFSNQIPVDSIQSMEVISGAPPAEFGGKTSLVIKVTTRSGLGQTQPTGSLTSSYGSFGSVNAGANLAIGGSKWGNFVSLSGLNTGRFLDPPENQIMHAKGNEENGFDRFDLQPNGADSIHLNFGYTRSWFQQSNSFDSQAIGQDQRAQVKTFNIAPSYTHLFNSTTLLTLGAFVRRDRFNYYPSSDPFSDLEETASQQRSLTNAGFHADVSYVKGANNLKLGATFQHTFLTENFRLGLTDPNVNSPCIDASGNPVNDPALTDPSQCVGTNLPNDGSGNVSAFGPNLQCFDLTRIPSPVNACTNPAGSLFGFHGHTDVKEFSLFVQDTITAGSWSFTLGLRGDIYRGLSSNAQAQPRVGIAYNVKRTNTVLRVSYARVMETPFNENLVIASSANPVAAEIFGSAAPIPPGQRNEFHAGFQQAIGKHLVIDGDYLWKYTHNAYDFSDFLNTPIFFPIAWNNSKINGFSVRASIPTYHGITAFFTASSVSARFFDPQVGGLGTDLTQSGVFRIDHDQRFQETTHIQYQPRKSWPWIGFNWRYDNGLVAGAVPFATDSTTPVDLSGLTADQQMQAGLVCGGTVPTLSTPLTSCAPSQFSSTRIRIPAPGTEDDDHNPPRVAPRHLFDASVGDDNLFNKDRYKWSLRLTVINMTNKVGLYNFLSTFSGTHFITPRSYTAELGFHF